MKAYKGFDKNMKCRGFQFEAGKDYEEDHAKLCDCGFHACTNPIDVLQYYGPATSIYREVELEGVCKDREKDSKVCAKKIHIGAELSLSKMIKLGVDIDIKSAKKPTSGNSSPAATSGKHSIAAAIGRNGKAKSTLGNWIVLAEYGDWNGECHPVLCVKTGLIDGKTLKPDVWYELKGGEFREAELNA